MRAHEPRDPIDELYGLEPVLDPATENETSAEPLAAVTITCPYCGENYGTLLDLSAGSSAFIEDCQVCCQPIELQTAVDGDGRLERLDIRRGD